MGDHVAPHKVLIQNSLARCALHQACNTLKCATSSAPLKAFRPLHLSISPNIAFFICNFSETTFRILPANEWTFWALTWLIDKPREFSLRTSFSLIGFQDVVGALFSFDSFFPRFSLVIISQLGLKQLITHQLVHIKTLRIAKGRFQ